MSSGKSSSGGSNSKSGRAGPDAGSRGSGKGRGPRPGQGRVVRTGPGQEAPQVRAGTAMFPFKMRRRGGGRRRRRAGGGGAGGGLREASRPLFHLLLPRGASGAALAAAPLRAARYDLPAALAPSALSAWPGTCAQIAAAANLPAPPSPVAPSLPPSLSLFGRPASARPRRGHAPACARAPLVPVHP